MAKKQDGHAYVPITACLLFFRLFPSFPQLCPQYLILSWLKTVRAPKERKKDKESQKRRDCFHITAFLFKRNMLVLRDNDEDRRQAAILKCTREQGQHGLREDIN